AAQVCLRQSLSRQYQGGPGPRFWPRHSSEPVVATWPVGSDRVEPGAADNTAQHGNDNDGVVGVAEDRYEIGDEIDRNSKGGQQQAKPDPDSAGEGLVTGQPAGHTQTV